MIVLGIETSCDETSLALVENGVHLLAEETASSASIQAQYGGVFPEVASRCHLETLTPTLEFLFKKGKLSPREIDAVAVTQGPGLIGSLLMGIEFAKGLSLAWKCPLIPIQHIEAHLYAAMMDPNHTPIFPSLGLVLSGGHTLLLYMQALGQYTLLGTTVDDAIGEALDKGASLLGLSYPGGPLLETLALKGDPQAFSFKGGQVKRNPLDFSFSGLKTALFYETQKPHSKDRRADLAAAFQEAAFLDVVSKTSKALEEREIKALYVGGGVTSNQRLRELLYHHFSPLPIHIPPPSLCTDNGAMVAGLAYHKKSSPFPYCLAPIPRSVFPRHKEKEGLFLLETESEES